MLTEVGAGPASVVIGQMIGGFRVLRKIGEGGMGVVYEGVDERIGQRVAIKLLHPRLVADDKSLRRFLNEARAISIIHHPGLVGIHSFLELPEVGACIVMEFLDGESLEARMETLRGERRRMPAQEAVEIIRQVASALAAAHRAGIIHCDMKPDNIFLTGAPAPSAGERIKVLDFGIAKFTADSGGKKTTVGLVLGTPQYMSPEQCDGREKLSDRVDVYSLGVIFYELLAGVPPFQSESSAVLLRQHIVRPPPPLVERAPHAAAELHALVHEMLAKEARDRPSMVEVMARLEGAPSRATSAARVLRWMRRYCWAILFAAIAAIAAAALWKGRRAQRAPESSGVAHRAADPAPVPPPVPAPPHEAPLREAPPPRPQGAKGAPRLEPDPHKLPAQRIQRPRLKAPETRSPPPPEAAPAPVQRKPVPITDSEIEPDR